MHGGQEITDSKALKLAMQDWALEGETKFTYRHNKSDATRKTPFFVYMTTAPSVSMLYTLLQKSVL